jgi:cell division protease FtsH
MICEWGMSETLGLVAYEKRSENGQYLGTASSEKNYSEATAKEIDEEVRKITEAAHKRAIEMIEQNKDKVELMTQMLMEFETLDHEDVMKILRGEWNTEEKRARLKAQASFLKQETKTPPPPPLPINAAENSTAS